MVLTSETSPLPVLPSELWDLVVEEMSPFTFEVFVHAAPNLHGVIKTSTKVQKQFPSVFQVLQKRSFIAMSDAKVCRQVCSTWKFGVDTYFQTTNFHSLENKNIPENASHFVLNMPMELVDIRRIQEMELHPGCVSFGNKMTLLMRHDQTNNGLFPNHLREINDLLRTVTIFWQRFDHLEVRRLDGITPADVNRINARHQRLENPDYIRVPFGDIGSEAKMRKWRELFFQSLVPDDFEMYIPFLHLMINLKKLTLFTVDFWISVRILHRIPKTANLEEIYMGRHKRFLDEFWRKTCTIMMEKCAESVTFLAGIAPESIVFRSYWNYNTTEPVFRQLKEIHILVNHKWTMCYVDSLDTLVIATMFPVVTTLVLSVDSSYIQCDLWNHLGNFANKFPRLNHFSLSGDCVPSWCTSLQTLSEAKTHPLSINIHTESILDIFQFQCPTHIPTGLLQMFPSAKHVIVEECPEKCQHYMSKSNDLNYVDAFFNTFPNVSTLAFLPVATSTGFGKITHFRGDYKCRMHLSNDFGKMKL